MKKFAPFIVIAVLILLYVLSGYYLLYSKSTVTHTFLCGGKDINVVLNLNLNRLAGITGADNVTFEYDGAFFRPVENLPSYEDSVNNLNSISDRKIVLAETEAKEIFYSEGGGYSEGGSFRPAELISDAPISEETLSSFAECLNNEARTFYTKTFATEFYEFYSAVHGRK